MMVELETDLLDRERKEKRNKGKKKWERIYEMIVELNGKSFGVCEAGRWRVEGGYKTELEGAGIILRDEDKCRHN